MTLDIDMIQAVRQCDGPFVELETKPIWILDLRQWMDEQTEATVGAGKKTKNTAVPIPQKSHKQN